MDKVFSVAAPWPDAPDGGGEMFVDLPATSCELLDIREKLRLGEGEAALFRVDEFYRFDFLAPHLSEIYGLPELNALAERLSELEPEQATVLAGLVQMDEAKQGGVLVVRTADHPGGYVERHSDPVQAYKEINEQPEPGGMEMKF